MREVVFEAGAGEDRALVLEGGAVVEAHLERPGARAGDVWRARLLRREARRAWVRLGGEEALLEPAPPGVAEGGLLTVAVRREAVAEPGRDKLARVASAEGDGPEGRLAAGPPLRARLGGAPGGDVEARGWSELVEMARTGAVPFGGGALAVARTAAGTVIDVDGDLPPADLAVAGAAAVARAVRLFDLGGSILVDFPTAPDARRAVGEALDAALPPPFDRTAMNGFGLVQIVRPKVRPSFLDRVRGEAVATAALTLLRAAERAHGAGELVVTTAPAVAAWLGARPDLLAELARRTGRRAVLRADPALPIWGGHG